MGEICAFLVDKVGGEAIFTYEVSYFFVDEPIRSWFKLWESKITPDVGAIAGLSFIYPPQDDTYDLLREKKYIKAVLEKAHPGSTAIVDDLGGLLIAVLKYNRTIY